MRRLGRSSLAATVTAGLATVALVAGCGSSGADSGGKVTINFIESDAPAAFKGLVKGFEAKNPNVEVKIVNVPFDQLDKVLQARLGTKDTSIDVLYADPSSIPSYVAKGWLTDLSSDRAKANAADLASTVTASTYRGKLYALPMWTSAQFLYYNKALLKKAGVTPPAMSPAKRWTWEQVVAAAKKAQHAGAQYGLLFDQTDLYYQMQALPESDGGGPGVVGSDLLTPDVTNAGWVKSMSWYRNLYVDKVAPRGVATDQMNVLFAAGKSAFFVGGPWSIGAFQNNKSKVDYGIAPHPYFTGGKVAMPTDSWSLGVSRYSEHQDAAKKFVEYMSFTKEGSLHTIDQILIPPANKQAYDVYVTRLDKSHPPATNGLGELMREELDRAAVHRPHTPGYVQMEDVLNKAFADIRNGADPKTTLAKAQKQLQSAFEQYR